MNYKLYHMNIIRTYPGRTDRADGGKHGREMTGYCWRRRAAVMVVVEGSAGVGGALT